MHYKYDIHVPNELYHIHTLLIIHSIYIYICSAWYPKIALALDNDQTVFYLFNFYLFHLIFIYFILFLFIFN